MRVARILPAVWVLLFATAAVAQTPAPTQKPRAARRTAAAQPRPNQTMTLAVTDMTGAPLADVRVAAEGQQLRREGATGPDGTVVFKSLVAGDYRVRFEHDGYTTLERIVTVQPKASRADVALRPAPAPPPPPPQAAPAPPAPQIVPSEASSVSIPDYVEKSFKSRSPLQKATLGCTTAATTTLLELRDPIPEHQHADADEALYVVAGEGAVRLADRSMPLRAGVFAVIPRGTSHTITRRNSTPLIVLSVLSGPPCTGK